MRKTNALAMRAKRQKGRRVGVGQMGMGASMIARTHRTQNPPLGTQDLLGSFVTTTQTRWTHQLRAAGLLH